MADLTDLPAQFAAACQRSAEYPLTVLRTDVFGHAQRSLQARLKQEGLFHPRHRLLYVRDLQEAATRFDQGRLLANVDDVEALLDPEEKDPWWRFIFLHSSTSRDPLGCSKEQLTMLLTYHQVMPSFLDLVFTFRARRRPLTYALFRHENHLDQADPSLPLPDLGRSGIQIQHAFNLLTVEKSKDPQERNQWPLRHACLYHSLDLKTGRAVYILMKGNGELAKRVKDATERSRHLRPDTPRTPEQSFLASLQVHLIMLEWAVESWSEYIDSMEERLRANSVEAKVAPVAHVTSPVNLAESFHRRGSGLSRRGTARTGLTRQGTMQTTGSRPGTHGRSNSRQDGVFGTASSPGVSPPPSPGSPIRAATRTLSGFLRRSSGGISDGGRSPTAQGQVDPVAEEKGEGGEGEEDEEEEGEPDALIHQLSELEERFSFNELQRLSLTGDEIDRSILALEQSRDVVAQVQEQYVAVAASTAYAALLDGNRCDAELASFSRRVRSILHDMGVHRRRLLDLSRTVANDKQMFESLNQHTSIQTSKAFQLVAQTSSNEMMQWTLKMHEIAVKTKQETLSMHVITIFTLIFLPGTFIATLFSSGVLRWDEDGTLGSDWVVRGDGIRLFLSICLPLTAVTLCIWGAMYGVARRWARRHRRDLGPFSGYADESAVLSAAAGSAAASGSPLSSVSSSSPTPYHPSDSSRVANNGGEKAGAGLGVTPLGA